MIIAWCGFCDIWVRLHADAVRLIFLLVTLDVFVRLFLLYPGILLLGFLFDDN
jgi:hypothetical protein